MVAVTVDGSTFSVFSKSMFMRLSSISLKLLVALGGTAPKKSGSTVLFILHSVGLDYELSAPFEKHRTSSANSSKNALFSVRWIFRNKSAPFQRIHGFLHYDRR